MKMKELEDRGIPVRERLLRIRSLSADRPIITLRWITREKRVARKRSAPAVVESGLLIYEDKVARRGLRVGDAPTKPSLKN